MAFISRNLFIMDNKQFNQSFKERTIQQSLNIMKYYSELKKTDSIRIIGKQLIRCSTSVGANLRAACVARSANEKFAKYCIVVEEADEMIYWIDLLNRYHINLHVPDHIISEANEIVKVMTACKRGLGRKIGSHR